MKNQHKVFRPKQWSNLILLLVCSAFVALGIMALKDKPFLGWLVITFFGLGVIVSLIQFYPNASYIKLNEEGFEVKSLFRAHFTKWSEVKDFRQGYISGNKMIFYNYTDEHKKWNSGKKVSKFLSGNEGAFQSTYNISTDKLMALMVDYKKRSNS